MKEKTNALRNPSPDTVSLDTPVEQPAAVRPDDVRKRATRAQKTAAWLGLTKRLAMLALGSLALVGSAVSIPFTGPIGIAGTALSGVGVALAVADVAVALKTLVGVHRDGSSGGGNDALASFLMWVSGKLGKPLDAPRAEMISFMARLALGTVSTAVGALGTQGLVHAGAAFDKLEHYGPMVLNAVSTVLLGLEIMFSSVAARGAFAAKERATNEREYRLREERDALRARLDALEDGRASKEGLVVSLAANVGELEKHYALWSQGKGVIMPC
ncbi:hypothetical protein [Paludibacterium paludis]|uniref:hypothetical protein n=1 Tax=Paludibacterium paludis TaxID=1225769 RepID=UPI001676DE41|nr:hypothetical protein [Paludibacterium paludis]